MADTMIDERPIDDLEGSEFERGMDDAGAKPEGDGAAAKPPQDGGKGREGGDPKGKQENHEEVKALKRQFEELQSKFRESEEEKRFWYEKARGAAEKPPAKREEEEPEAFESMKPEEAIELLTTRGIKGLVDKGLVSERRVKAMIGSMLKDALEAQIKPLIGQEFDTRIQGLQKQTTLIAEYPDLAKPDSDFYKATQAEYEAIVADEPELKGTRTAMKMAARLAAVKTPSRKESDRMDRIRRQMPDGVRNSKATFDDDDGFSEEGMEFGSKLFGSREEAMKVRRR